MMAGLLVCEAAAIAGGQLLLRAGEHSLTQNLDPKTTQPGDLPNSLVDFVDYHSEGVHVVFQDGTDLEFGLDDYVEAVCR